MALRSMTGFGHCQRQANGLDWACDVRSVNHKGLEVRISAPSWLLALEGQAQEIVRRHVSRGRLHIHLQVDIPRTAAKGEMPLFDLERARALVRQLDQLRNHLAIVEPPRLDHILTFPGVIRRVDEAVEPEQAGATLEAVLTESLLALLKERDREGEVLAADFQARLELIRANIESIAAEVPIARDVLFTRMRDRLAETVQRFGLGEIPEERLLQEVVLYTDRSDITEEITRARAHIERLQELIQTFTPQADGGVGKKMDFYFQELIRETNTMGSKSQHERIAVLVVENRSEIDRMREQVLNIE